MKKLKKLFIKYYLYVNNYTMINKHLFSADYFSQLKNYF